MCETENRTKKNSFKNAARSVEFHEEFFISMRFFCKTKLKMIEHFANLQFMNSSSVLDKRAISKSLLNFEKFEVDENCSN